MKKKLIAAAVSLTMAVTMVPSFAFAAASSDPTVETTTASTEQDDTQKKLEQAKTKAKDDLAYYWGDADATKDAYDAAGRTEISQIRTEGGADIDKAENEEAVTKALDAAKAKIDAVETIKEKYDAAKTEATEAINNYWGQNGQEIAADDDYDSTVKDEISAIKSTATSDINAATTAEAVNDIKDRAFKAIDAKDTIAEHKDNVKAAIDEYYPEGLSADDYDNEEKEAINTAKTKAKEAIDEDTANADMDAEFNNLKSTVDAVKTTAQKALEKAQTDAKAELDTYFPKGVTGEDAYAPDQKTAITNAKSEGASAIEAATTTDEVADALEAAKKAIDAIPTSATLKEQTTDLIAKIEAIGTVTIQNYNDKYDAIKAAEDLYKTLSDAGVKDENITNKGDLVTARTNYDTFKAYEVVDQIDALGTIDKDNYVDKKDALEAAEAEFAKISATNAGKVSNSDALTTARTKYEELVTAVTTFEEKVTTDLGDLDPVAYTNKTVVEGVTTEYNNLSEMQKSQIKADIQTVYKNAADTIKAFDEDIAAVKKQIDDLPDPIEGTPETKDALTSARTAYAELNDADAQTAVDNFGALQTAEAAYVDALIDAIGDTGVITNDVIANTEAARAAYDELNEVDKDAADKVQKAADLTAAEKAISAYREAIGQAAYNEAEIAFEAVKDVTEVTDDNVNDVETAIEAYNQLNIADPEKAKDFTERFDELGMLVKTYADAKAAAEKELADTQKMMNASVKVADQFYTGSAIQPQVTVTDKSGKTIAADQYDLFFTNNLNVGEATVTVVAKNNSAYTGSKAATFKIAARSISGAAVSGIANKTYTGKPITQSVSVAVAGRTLANGTDYTVSYSNNKAVGKATVKITAKGNYTGSIDKTFRITPAKGAIKSLKAGKKKMTVKIKAQSGAKYQIAYKVKGAKKYKTVKVSSTSKTIKKLKKGKTYTVKVRAYKAIDGKTYYGAYSKTKNVRVK
ncbi:hypothetical protein NE619_16590 [Anaerovorax odorimutans]|uniref:Fibronectin type-III domain-containing protein n=1 Tax=Anaerovorax odorimutans TaxID=109327 RepID=A0ABT1RT63_9FIRM|nr:hypothetical protein [Anaerovorax odorimutans]MCQ4638350.1 hypothetical protein [Anaerovorax odorimutans]